MDQTLGSWAASEERIKKHLIFLLFFTIYIVFIVNNGNILFDDINEKKYLRRKYSEM